MKEYEIHCSFNYMTDGGTEEDNYWVAYRWANSTVEAEELITEELKKHGYYNITADAIEA